MPSCNICQCLQIDLVILNIRTYDVIEKLLRQLESQGKVVNQQRMLVHQLLSKFFGNHCYKLEDTKNVTKCGQQSYYEGY